MAKLEYESRIARPSRRPSLVPPVVGLLLFGTTTVLLVFVAVRAYQGEAGDVATLAGSFCSLSTFGFAASFAWAVARLKPRPDAPSPEPAPPRRPP